MKLSLTDIAYIDTRLDEHGLKYQEIYDEIRDHVLVAMSAARESGDKREIESVYKDMVEAQFPGYYPFERIAVAYEKAYRKKVKKMVWVNVQYYLKPLNAVIIALAIAAGYYLPENTITYALLLAVFLIAAISPFIYARIKTAKIKIDDGKQSIVKVHITSLSTFWLYLYLGITGVNFFLHNGVLQTAKMGYRPPTANLFMIAFAIVYGLSVARLCRQEIKCAAINSNELIVIKP